MTPKEFNDCLNRIKNGDSRGMEPIYVNYYEKLVLTANCELHDRGRAEEVASSVMITIFENAGHYEYINFPDAWMYKAVKFAVIRQKQRLQREMLTDFSDFRYESKDEGMTFGIAFRGILENCTSRQREIVLLHFVYGLNIRKTAKAAGISVSTVKREISAVRSRLEFLRKID